MSNPKISVIVPIYNAEKYLHRCVDSILNQTFTDFEVLLINDGSTDSSGLICDEYALKDSRVRVFHKENGGVSSARNVGIKSSRYRYLALIDSDDYWLDAYLDNIQNLILKNPNCSVYGSRQILLINNNQRLSSIKPFSDDFEGVIEDYFSRVSSSFLFHTSATVFDKVILSNFEILYNESLTRGEDLDVLFRVIYHGSKVCFTSKPLTYYDSDTLDSLMKTDVPLEKRFMNILANTDYIKVYNRSDFKRFINNYLFSCLNLLIYEEEDTNLIKSLYKKISFRKLTLSKRIFYLIPFYLKRIILKERYGN